MQERNVWSHGSNLVEGKKTYITALLFGLPNVQIAKLQRVQNAAARLILDFQMYLWPSANLS